MKKLLLSAIGLVSVFLFLFIFFAQAEEEAKAVIIPKVTSLPGWDLVYLKAPEDVSVLPDGTFYVTDWENDYVKKIDSTGTEVLSIGTTGSGNGQLDRPRGVVHKPDGSEIYVLDSGNNRVQRFSGVDGSYIGQWGSSGSGNGQFNLPNDITLDSAGNVYVTDKYNDRIQVFSSTGTYLRQWGVSGAVDSADFVLPDLIEIDASDNVYVGDNNYIKKYSTTGVYETRWMVHASSYVSGLDVNSSGNIVASDTYTLTTYSPVGVELSSWEVALNQNAKHLSLDSSDNVYYSSSISGPMVIKTDASGTYIREWSSWGDGDGQLRIPQNLFVVDNGDVYIADTSNDRIQVFDGSGNYLRKWGGTTGTGDGEFNSMGPTGIAVDSSGKVYVNDTGNNRVQIFDSNGVYLNEWAIPSPIAINYKNGQIYLVGAHTIYVKDTAGNTLLQAASGTFGSGDGELNGANGISADAAGNIYVADSGNHRVQVFDNSGVFVRKWGTMGSGDNQFQSPYDIEVHPNGKVFVVDRYNHRIQKFFADGTYDSSVGSFGSGDNEFSWPMGMAIGSDGFIYVADSINHRIEKYDELFQVQSLAAEFVALSLAGDDLEVGSTEGRSGSETVRLTEPSTSTYAETEMSVNPTSLPGDKIVLASVTPSTVIGGGVAQSMNGDDSEWTYNLPFTFSFYGTDYTSLKIGSNGKICPNTANDCTGIAGNMPYATFPTIQPFGMDLVTDRAGLDIFITEESDRVIIRWVSEEYDQSDGNVSGGTVEFETVLYLNGKIQFNYGQMPDGYAWTDGPDVGISSGDGNDYVESVRSIGPGGDYKTLLGANSVIFNASYDKTYADITTNFQDDLDWSSITATADVAAGKVVIDGLDIAAGVDSYTLYVPQLDGDDGVHLCPTETTLVGLTTACTDGYNLGQVEDSVGTTTIASVDYWVIPTADVKGAFSTTYDPAFAPPEPPAAPVTTPETPAEEDPVVTPVYYAASAEEDTTEEVVEEEGDTDEETTVKDIINTVLEKSEEIKAETESSYLKRLWWFLIPALALGGWFEIERRKK